MHAQRTEGGYAERTNPDSESDARGYAHPPPVAIALNREMDCEDDDTEKPRGKAPPLHASRRWRHAGNYRRPSADEDIRGAGQ